jgi:proteasome lid subunit RPN8/RPN11
MEPDVLIAFDAARTIIKDSADCDVETGGVIVGTLGEPITIVAAGSPGKNSSHFATSFTSDPQADKQCLEENRKKYGNQITLGGWWHKHPYGMITPSGGDCHQVRELISQYNDNKPLLVGIVNQRRSILRRKTTLYLYNVDSSGKIVEYHWKLVNRKDKRLLAAIANAAVTPDTTAADYWSDKNFQSYLNPIGRERINREIEQLKQAGWLVKTSRNRHNKLLILTICRNHCGLTLTLPPEFPLNPPTVAEANSESLLRLSTLCRWNSLCSLADVAAETELILGCPLCSTRIIHD